MDRGEEDRLRRISRLRYECESRSAGRNGMLVRRSTAPPAVFKSVPLQLCLANAAKP